jgi:WD40 repeat protein
MGVADVHPSAEELTAFTLGALEGEAHSAIEAHVGTCASCQESAAVAPDDTLLQLLRRAHARMDQAADTVAAAPVQTPAPHAAPAEVVTFVLPAPLAAPAEADDPALLDAVPPDLAGHERYRIVRRLGGGGMGVVYEAEHRIMQRPVALKVINRAYTVNVAAVERFRREVRAAARLAHPNIVTAYDAENAGATHFLVMEYVEGQGLGRLVQESGPLPVAEACDYVRQAALGLQHAHERGMVHRDVKPDNLIRCADGTVKVLDFGLAALTAERTSGVGGLTDDNLVMGTPDYMAPEQAENARAADIRADVYSLGCTLYYLLTGSVPYPAPTPLLKILAHRDQPPPSLRRARPDVPPELASVLARMLAKKPDQRYQTPGEVATALEPFAHPRQEKRSRRWLWVPAALLLTAVVGAAVLVHRIQTDTGELVITTESDNVEVVVAQGGKVVRVIDADTGKEIKLALRSGTYELELQGAPEGLKLTIGKVTLTRGETVLAKIERVLNPVGPAQVQREVTIKPLHHIRFAEGGRFASVGVTQDGRYFLANRTDHEVVRVWETETGQLLQELKHGYIARFTPDGKQVVMRSWRPTDKFEVHDIATGKMVRQFGSGPAGGIFLSATGTRFLTLPDGAQVWDWSTGTKLCDLPWPTGVSAAWTHDMSHLILQQSPGKPPNRVYDMGTGKPSDALARFRDVPFLPPPHDNTGAPAGFSWDGKRYFMPDADWKFCTFYDRSTGKQIACFDVRARDILRSMGPQISGDHRLWVGKGKERDAYYVWDVDSGRRLAILEFPASVEPAAVSLSYDGRTILFAVEPDSLYVFRLPKAPSDRTSPVEKTGEAWRYQGHTNWVTGVAFSPDGQRVLSSSADGTVRLLDARTGKLLRSMSHRSARSVAFFPDGKRAISTGWGGDATVRIWDLETGEELKRFGGYSDPVNGVAVSPDGKRVLFGVVNVAALLLEIEPEKELRRFNGPASVIALSADGKQSLMINGATIQLWDNETGKELKRLEGQKRDDQCVAISPDSKWAVSGGKDKIIQLWDLETGKEVRRMAGHTLEIHGIAFSPDGKWIASGSYDGTVRLWDAATGKELLRLEGHTEAVHPDGKAVLAVAFAPDGRSIVSAGKDRSVRLWRLPDAPSAQVKP